MLAIAYGCNVALWKLKTGPERKLASIPHSSKITALCWSHTGQTLAMCAVTVQKEHSVSITSLSTGRTMHSFQHDSAYCNSQTEATIEIKTRCRGTPTSITFGGKSRYLCISDDRGLSALWDLKKELRVRSFHPSELPTLQIAMDDTHTYILSGVELHIILMKDGTVATLIQATSSLFTCFQLLPGWGVAIGTQSGDIELYQIHNPQEIELSLLTTAHRAAIRGMAIVSSQLMVSCSSDGTLCLIQLQDKTMIQCVHLTGDLTCVSAAGFLCAVGNDRGQVLVYDVERLREQPLATIDLAEAIATLSFEPTTIQSQPDSQSVLCTPPRQTMVVPPNSARQLDTTTLRDSVNALSKMVDQVLCASPLRESQLNSSAFPPRVPNDSSNGCVTSRELQTIFTLAIDTLRDDVSESIQNLHVDMIRQFRLQQKHISAMLIQQSELVEQLRQENDALREENRQLTS